MISDDFINVIRKQDKGINSDLRNVDIYESANRESVPLCVIFYIVIG